VTDIRQALAQDRKFAQNAFSGGLDISPQSQRAGDFLRNLNPPQQRSSFGLFLESALSAGTKELVGSRSSRHIERFRAEQPIAGTLSWLAGSLPFFMAPQLGIVRGLSAGIPGFTAALRTAGKLKDSGKLFRAAGLREATMFAPLEAGRIAGSALNPEEGSFKRGSISAASELAALGVFGGGIGFVGGKLKNLSFSRTKTSDPTNMLATELRVAQHVGQDFNRSAPIQTKWEFIKEYKKTATPENKIFNDLDDLLAAYEHDIKFVEPPRNPQTNSTQFVAKLEDKRSTRRVDSLFVEGKEGARGAKGIIPRIFKTNNRNETRGFKSTEETDASFAGFIELATQAGLKDSWQAVTQFPRELVSTGLKSKARLIQILREDFTRVSETEWRVREAASGLNIIVKRLEPVPSGNFLERAAQRVDPMSGRFYTWKTHSPTKWLGDASKVYETNAEAYTEGLHRFFRVVKVPDGSVPTLVMAENISKFYDANLAQLFTGKTRFSPNPNVGAEVGRLRLGFERLLPQTVREGLQEPFRLVGEFGNAARVFGAPARLQAGQNPRLNNLLLGIRELYEVAGAKANNISLGKVKSDFMTGADKPLFALFKSARNIRNKRTGGTEDLIRKRLATEEALADFNRINIEHLLPEEAQALGLNRNAVKLAFELDLVNEKEVVNEILSQSLALGTKTPFTTSKAHMGIVNTWIGPFRAPWVEIATGKVVGYGSGFTRSQAAQDANRITSILNKESIDAGGKKLLKTYGDIAGRDVDMLVKDHVVHAGNASIEGKLLKFGELRNSLGLPTDLNTRQADLFGFATHIDMGNPLVDKILRTRAKLFREDPLSFRERKGFFGARGTTGQPFSVDELVRTHSAHIIETKRYLAREAIAAGPFQEQLAILTAEDSAAAVTFNRVFNSYNGISGPVSKTVEAAMDAVLADVLGVGSATKMVRGANRAMFMLTLGAMDIGFATLNMITPIQTAWPEVAFLLNAAPEIIQKYYSNALFRMPGGGFRSGSFMDVAKFAKVATQKLLNPNAGDKQAIQRAIEEHVIGRDFIETAHGAMRNMVEGRGGMWDSLQRFSEFPVVFSEEASRTYSFLLGRQVGKDFFRMGEEEAFHFARQFVNNTMYGYSAADRPRMLTGALGAGWGLFKNWTANYTGNLARYTGEASRGNFAPLMWSMSGTASVGGLAAMPFAGMADGFARLMGDKPMSDLIYDWVGNDPMDNSKPWMADMMMHGVFSNLGLTLRSRASVPSSHLATDLMMFSNISILDRASAALKGLGTAVDDAMDFRVPLANPKFRREMLQAFAPRTLQRAMTSFGERGVTSLNTGNSLLPALNLYEGLFRSIGLTPIKVANAFEVHQNERLDADAKRDAIQKLGRRMADAELNRDWMEIGRIVNEAAWEHSVPIDSVQRSMNVRLRNLTQPVTTRQFDSERVRKRLQSRNLF